MTEPEASYSERVLLVAPTQRDEAVTRRLLEDAGFEVAAERDFHRITDMVAAGVGTLLITDITLADPGIPMLMAALRIQPTWSALPVVALCQQGAESPAVAQLLRRVHNAIVLDRPASKRGLLSALTAARHARRAQYVIRDQIRKLQQAEEALRQADRRKDEFLATLAHELRNPLAPMRTGLAVLERTGPGDERSARVRGMMDRQLAQMVKLIDELLDVSRIATGKIVLRAEPLDMREIVRVAVENCDSAIRESAHQIKLDIPESSITVLGDAARLSQVVTNLIGNAVKYTPPNGLIRIALLREGGQAILRVADNGLGIPGDMLEQVFELFAQVNHTLDRSQGGLGIGLSLVRRLVELHGGRVVARSEGTGQGSTFEMSLPLTARRASSGMAAAPIPAAQLQARQLKVLIIDDNVDAADSLGMLLQSLGHETRVAYGGLPGIDAICSFGPEAVFCDIGMPGVNGLDVAATIHSRADTPAPVLIALTGFGTDADRERTRLAGFDFHLTKPANWESVCEILQNVQVHS